MALEARYGVRCPAHRLAAVSAYSEKQGAEILARQGAGDADRQAQINAEAAPKERSPRPASRRPPAARRHPSKAIVTRSRDLAQTEARDRGGRGKAAKGHEAPSKRRSPASRGQGEAAAIDRAADAQRRLDRAQEATKAGPAEVSMLATVIAGRTGQAPEDIARSTALGTTLASIAVTLIMTLLAQQAVKLLMTGFGMSSIGGEVKPEVAPSTAEPKAARKLVMLATMTDDDRLDHFNQTEVLPRIAAKPLTSKELYELLNGWWLLRLPGAGAPSQRKLAERMKAAGLHSQKVRGAMTYGAELAAAA